MNKEEDILDIDPDDLTQKECLVFSSNKELKERYKEIWGTTGSCQSNKLEI